MYFETSLEWQAARLDKMASTWGCCLNENNQATYSVIYCIFKKLFKYIKKRSVSSNTKSDEQTTRAQLIPFLDGSRIPVF